MLDDPRASRHHAHIRPSDDGGFVIVDGYYVNGQIHRSANKVYVNGEQKNLFDRYSDYVYLALFVGSGLGSVAATCRSIATGPIAPRRWKRAS